MHKVALTKLVYIVVLFALVLFGLSFQVLPRVVQSVNAKTPTPSPSPSPTPIPASSEASVSAQEVDSFTLFWPLVAGKTKVDGFTYQIKRLKENIRGMLIFNDSAKSDYQVFLATKRLLEAEKLLKENNKDAALSTLKEVGETLAKAEVFFDNALSKNGVIPTETRTNIDNQLKNIDTFVNWFKAKNEAEVNAELDNILSKTSSIRN